MTVDPKTAAALAAFSDDDLRAELARRDQERMEEYWKRQIANAKYLCSDCGMPDGWHTRDCPSDALDTAT